MGPLFDVCQLTKDSKQHQHSPMKSLQFRSIGERIHSIKGLAFIRMSPVRRTLSLSITSLTSNISVMEEFYCIFCSEIVTSRQEALLKGRVSLGQPSHVPACNKSLFLDYGFQGAGVTRTTHMSLTSTPWAKEEDD